MRTFEAMVLGGGVAGCVAARELALSGCPVAVLAASRCDEAKVGETVPPEIQVTLRKPGLWERFLADGHLASPGISSAWGGPDLAHRDFIRNPYGSGWNLDRRRFDRMLTCAAREAGVEWIQVPRQGARCGRDQEGWWIADAGVRARLLLDASGRGASGCHQSRAALHDNLTAVVTFGKRQNEATHCRTIVEAGPEGWWYAAVLPEGRAVITYMTDARFLAGGPSSWAGVRSRALESAPHTSALASCLRESRTFAVAANTVLRQACGDSWAAAGEALLGMDPLCSQGILFAFESGHRAARELLAPNGYAAWADQYFAAYMAERRRYYSLETRWPDAPFWAARHRPV